MYLKCSFCRKLKHVVEFIKDCTQPSGYHQKCKQCEGIIRGLKKRIPSFTPEQRLKLLLKLYIEYEQFPTQLYRLFECDVKYIYEALKEADIRRCKNPECWEIKSYSEFYNCARSEDGFNRWCKSCSKKRANESMKKSYTNDPTKKQEKNYEWRLNHLEEHRDMMLKHYYNNKDQYRHNNQKRKQLMRNAIPPWADLVAIKEIYCKARELELLDGIPRHVDHDIPLNHELVCGLHVETNLKILTDDENRCKSNYFEPIYLTHQIQQDLEFDEFLDDIFR